MTEQTRTHAIEPDITVYEIAGRLTLGNTLSSVETAIRTLVEGGCRRLIIDLSQLTYIDSAAMGMFVGANTLMGNAGGTLRISGAAGLVAKAFAITRLDKILRIDPDLDASTRALAAGA